METRSMARKAEEVSASQFTEQLPPKNSSQIWIESEEFSPLVESFYVNSIPPSNENVDPRFYLFCTEAKCFFY
jgi:hypothetical protein